MTEDLIGRRSRMTILPELIKEVLELDEKATRGPWNYCYDGSGDYSIGPDDPQSDKRTCHIWAPYNERPSQNAPLIAHYRTSAPKLAKACFFYMRIIDALSKEKDTNVHAARVQYIEDVVEKIVREE